MSYFDRFKEQKNEIKYPDSTAKDCNGREPLETIVALLFISVVLCFGISILLLLIKRKKMKKIKTGK